MEGVINKLKSLDAYPKINEDFYSRSLAGGVITLVSGFVMFLLFLSELRLYLHTVNETKLLVDTSRGEKLRIHFDVTFPEIPCTILSLDAMDISGEQHLDIKHDITKKRINAHGNIIEARQDSIGAPKIERPLQRHGGRLDHNETYCGSCFGAEAIPFCACASPDTLSTVPLIIGFSTYGTCRIGHVGGYAATSDDHCCNSCEDVREAYRKKGWALTNPDLIDQCKREGFFQKVKDEEGEGCNVQGSLEVNKVAGNFHFVPGKSFHHADIHMSELLDFQNFGYNISHRINKLAFGGYFPRVINPLDRSQWVQQTSNGVYQYFLKVVPTVYKDVRGRTINSNQYSVTEHFKSSDFAHSSSLPGVVFFYDLSPIKVIFKEEHTPFLHFMTHICAIIGGIFTVAGIIDSFVYHGQRAIKKKV